MTREECVITLQQISMLRKDYEKYFRLSKEDLEDLALHFDNYYNMYVFAKQHCSTQEEFNNVMWIIRPIFLDHIEHI